MLFSEWAIGLGSFKFITIEMSFWGLSTFWPFFLGTLWAALAWPLGCKSFSADSDSWSSPSLLARISPPTRISPAQGKELRLWGQRLRVGAPPVVPLTRCGKSSVPKFSVHVVCMCYWKFQVGNIFLGVVPLDRWGPRKLMQLEDSLQTQRYAVIFSVKIPTSFPGC